MSEPLRDDDIRQIPQGERAWVLLDAVLNGNASEEERKELEGLVVAHPAVARLCVRGVHLWYSLKLHMQRDRETEELLREQFDWNEIGLDETMILPSLREEEGARYEGDGLMAEEPVRYSRRIRQQTRWPVVAAAAVVVLGMTGVAVWMGQKPAGPAVAREGVRRVTASLPAATQGVSSMPVAAVAPVVASPVAGPTTQESRPLKPEVVKPEAAKPDAAIVASAGAVMDGVLVDPGMKLTAGRSVRLMRGAVEVVFGSGAKVVVTAPAEFHMTDRNSMGLESGSVAASVPHEAVGFTVQAPGMAVVDHGTNFGVRIVDSGAAAETAVFDGVVEAVATDARRQQTGTPVRLTAGQAVRREVLSADQPLAIAYAPEKYTREVKNVRLALPVRDTGLGVAAGAADPDWEVVSVPNDAKWKPRPAVTVSKRVALWEEMCPGWSWISLSAGAEDVALGQYVFRTTVDLTGFDPTTVQLSAQMAADDELVELRINGEPVPVQKLAKNGLKAYLLDLSGLKWREGRNELEVVVLNTGVKKQKVSPTGLSVKWSGTACPVVRRQG